MNWEKDDFTGVALAAIVVICLMFSPPISFASNRPFWTEKSSWVEAERIYVVGVSTKNKTLEEGRELALKNAEKELLALLHVDSLQGVMFETQMTHQEQEGDGTWSVCRLMWVPVNEVRKLDQQGVARSSQLRCVGTYTGVWVGRMNDRVIFKEDCKFVYIGNGCTSTGTYPALHDSGSVPISIDLVTGAEGCLPVGRYTCNYIFVNDRLAYDCGQGQAVYERLVEIVSNPPPTQVIVRKPEPVLEVLRFLIHGR